jgi:putative ABC transport system permease protein
LEFFGHDYTVAGVLETTGTGLDTSVFVPIDTAYVMAKESATKAVTTLDIPNNTISAVLVKVSTGTNVEVVANQIKAKIQGVDTITADLMLGKVGQQLSSVVQGLYTTTVAVTVVMLPMIGVIASMVVNERRQEIGLLRALGSTKRFIFGLVTLETVLTAAIGGALGAISVGALLYSFTTLIMKTFGVPYLWLSIVDTGTLAITYIAVAVGVGALAVLYPAVAASRMEPYMAMRREP